MRRRLQRSGGGALPAPPAGRGRSPRSNTENGEALAFWQHVGYAVAGRLDRGVTVFEKVL